MNALEFCYWLQGFAETSDSKEVTEEQWNVIKNKLNSVQTLSSYVPYPNKWDSPTLEEIYKNSQKIDIWPTQSC